MRLIEAIRTAGLVVALSGCAVTADRGDPAQAAAIADISTHIDRNVVAEYERLDAKQAADRLNGRAWYDVRDDDLILIRNGRDAIARMSADLLSLEFAPNLSSKPSAERAHAFFDADGFGRRLLGLTRGEELRFTKEYGALGGRRFGFQQWHEGWRIWNAQANLKLDRDGRFAGLDSSLIPKPAPDGGVLIPESEAVALAIADLIDRNDPLWRGVTPELEGSERIFVDLLPITGRDATRPAYLVMLRPPVGEAGGRRDVVVDALDGTVLASIEKIDLMVDGRDGIYLPRDPAVATNASHFELEWSGNMADCPPRRATGPLGTSPIRRDIDETRGALCETVRYFADRGGEFGVADFRWWIDQPDDGVRINLGADIGGASVGANWGSAGIALAPGVGRAEIVGHEFGHYLFGNEGAAAFKGGGDDGAAIEEHMNDVLGLILEHRGGFFYPGEDRCLMNDDPDSLDTQEALLVPPLCRGQRLPWRSACEPQRDNSGHCEGARRALDLASNPRYDLLGSATESTRISHTDIGVGNRVATALMAPVGTRTNLAGWFVDGLGMAAIERLFPAASLALPPQSSWSDYAKAWTEAVERTGLGAAAEGDVRGALSSAEIWNLPKVMMTVGPAAPILGGVSQRQRPAVASIIREGTERSYFFYREEGAGGAIFYVWRDEVPGFSFADTPGGDFTGPCRLGTAVTHASVAAVGRGDRLYAVWAAATATAGIGRIDGMRLLADDTGDSGCAEDRWESYPPGRGLAEEGEIPGVERLTSGGPALAIWQARSPGSPPEQVVTPPPWLNCTPHPAALSAAGDRAFPISPIAPSRFLLGPCFYDPRVPGGGPPIPFPPLTVDRLNDLLPPAIGERAVRSVPSLVDPLAPALVPENDEIVHRFDLLTNLQSHIPLISAIDDIFTRFQAPGPFAEDTLPIARGAIALPTIGFPNYTGTVRYFLNGPPVITLTRNIRELVLAFRDPEGRLRIVDYDDRRDTNFDDGSPRLAVLAEEINDADPALAVVPMRRGREFLVAVYGAPHNGRPTGIAYRTARSRSAPALSEASFTPAERIDRIRGREPGILRRLRDYAYARTFEAPVISGSRARLHLFTAELAHLGPSERDYEIAPGNPNDPDYDPYPDTAVALPFTKDHIRYSVLSMREDGGLEAYGERPVQLPYTAVMSSLGVPQVGAVQRTQHRQTLRYYQPGNSQVLFRSRTSR